MADASPDTSLPNPPPPPGPRPFERFWTGVGVGVLGAVLLIFGGFAILALVLNARMKGLTPEGGKSLLPAPPLPANATADYEWSVRTLDDQPVEMASFKGKIVFLNFWATWCGPCVAEMASIQRLWELTKDDGAAFVVASNEEPGKISAFLEKRRLTLPVYRMKGEPPAAFQTTGIPATFILSPDGRILLKHIGAAQWDHPDAVTFLRGLKVSSPR
jgi:thiol-disulfide isomerase/thioredoxin